LLPLGGISGFGELQTGSRWNPMLASNAVPVGRSRALHPPPDRTSWSAAPRTRT
jgi:hypothetical protein